MVQEIYRPIKLPLYPLFWHFAVGAFIGALLTDITYWQTAEMTWANFSAWLLAAGLVVGAVSVLLLLVDWLLSRLAGLQRPGFVYILGILAALALEFVNSLIHSRDAWTSVVPVGLTLSAASVIVIVLTGAFQRSRTYRYIAGVEA